MQTATFLYFQRHVNRPAWDGLLPGWWNTYTWQSCQNPAGFWVLAVKCRRAKLSKQSTVFIWQQPWHYGEITPQGKHRGAGDGATGSHSSSVPPRLVQNRARGQEGPLWCMRSRNTSFHPVSWEEKGVWVGMCAGELLGCHGAAFVKGWVRSRKLCDERKLSPPAAQNKQALFLCKVFLIVCWVTQWLVPSLRASYQVPLLTRKPVSDTSGELMPWSHLGGMHSLGGEPSGNEWACLKLPQAQRQCCDSSWALRVQEPGGGSEWGVGAAAGGSDNNCSWKYNLHRLWVLLVWRYIFKNCLSSTGGSGVTCIWLLHLELWNAE